MDRKPLHFTNSKQAQDVAVGITGDPGEGSTLRASASTNDSRHRNANAKTMVERTLPNLP